MSIHATLRQLQFPKEGDEFMGSMAGAAQVPDDLEKPHGLTWERDAADELIVAPARVQRSTLLTADNQLQRFRHAQIRHFNPLL